MSEKDQYSGLSWMSDEMKAHMRLKDAIVKNKDFEGLFSLEDNSDFSTVLHEILRNRHEENPEALNRVQLNLFLCMHLENAGQADHILSFLQESFPNYHEAAVRALNEIGAIHSALLIKQAIALLPEDGSWFFDTAGKTTQDRMDKLDSKFSDYPDGFMRDLYRTYASKHRKEVEYCLS